MHDRPLSVAAFADRHCLLCGGEAFEDLHIPQRPMTMRKCLGCGLWVNANLGDAPDPGEHYDPAYFDRIYGAGLLRRRRNAPNAVRAFEAVEAPGRFLDIGCAEGFILEAAQARGWKACAVEVSSQVVEALRNRGLDVSEGDLRHIPFPDGSFDVVRARHVLEHDVEVYESLHELNRVLRDGGVLVLEVPDMDAPKVRRRRERYDKFWHPEHMLGFTAATLDALLRWAGFRSIGRRTFRAASLGGAAGVVPFLGWELNKRLREALGLATWIRGFHRKVGAPQGAASIPRP